MECQINTYKIVNIISSLLLIIAYVFIMIQSYKNLTFNKNNNSDIIAERLVYEQFSHEVYSNILSKMIVNISYININEECPQDYKEINIPIKMESFYDCEDIDNIDNIDKDICQNKITSSSLCCRKQCCKRVISGKKDFNYCRNKDNVNEDDPREYFCSKFSKYKGRFYIYNNQKICVKKDRIYEDLLLDYETYDKSKTCDKIYFDSKQHFICNDNFILTNQNKAIIKNIFSVTQPNYFEMESKIRLSILLNKIKYDEDKIKKELNKISKISSKTIYDAFIDKKCNRDECLDANWIQRESNKISEIINTQESIFYNLNEYILNSNIIWYTRNFIGFENYTELQKFKLYFDSNDHKNNPLYKISTNTLHPSCASFIIGIIISVLSVIYVCLLIKEFKQYEYDYLLKNFNMNVLNLLIIFILFLIYLIIYLAIYVKKFEEINIDMENFYEKVLERYNQRRKQIYLVIGIIILFVNIFVELINQNLKCGIKNNNNNGMNGRSINTITVKVKFKETNCQNEHTIKLYPKKSFSEFIPKINKILSKCPVCRNDDPIFYYYREREIVPDTIIKNIGITNNSTIDVE